LPHNAAKIKKQKLVRTGLITSVFFAVLAYFLIPYAIHSLFPNFLESIPAAQIITFGVIPMTFSAIMNSELLGSEKTKPVFMSAIIYLCTLIVLLILLGKNLGLIG